MHKGRKISGGKYIKSRKKKRYEAAGQRKILKLGEEKRKIKRVRGGGKTVVLLKANFVNIQENGKSKRVKIKNVVETPSNRFLARQNVITKGTILDTEAGKVKITSRPIKEGVVNGVLVK